MGYFSKSRVKLSVVGALCAILMLFGCSVEQEFSVGFETTGNSNVRIETNGFKVKILPNDTVNTDLNRTLDASLAAINDLEMIQNLESELIELRLNYPDLVDLEKLLYECTQRKLIAVSQIRNNCGVVLTILPTVQGGPDFFKNGVLKAKKDSLLIISSVATVLNDDAWFMLVSLGDGGFNWGHDD